MDRLFRTKELPPLVPSLNAKAQQDLTTRVMDDRLTLAETIRRRAGAHSIAVVLTADEARRVITELERL